MHRCLIILNILSFGYISMAWMDYLPWTTSVVLTLFLWRAILYGTMVKEVVLADAIVGRVNPRVPCLKCDFNQNLRYTFTISITVILYVLTIKNAATPFLAFLSYFILFHSL